MHVLSINFRNILHLQTYDLHIQTSDFVYRKSFCNCRINLNTINMSDHFGPITLKWDPKNLEIRTMSVEKTLEPLVLQVTTLVNTKGPSKKKKGKSKRASALVGTVEKATTNFIEKGEKIAYENPDITAEMLSAVEEVRKTGAAMSIAAR